MRKKLVLISDPLINDFGPSRPVVLLSREFSKSFDVSVVSSIISVPIAEKLESSGVTAVDLKMKPFMKDASLAFFDLYLREAVRGSIGDKLDLPYDATVLNFSNTIVHSSLAWYAQGPVSIVLRNIRKELPLRYKLPLHIFDYVLTKFDIRMIKRMHKETKAVVTNSQYCKSCYERIGIKISKVIHEPLDCDFFRPSTLKPSADYALTYFGKETKYSVIKKIADEGVRIKAFGGKLSGVSKSITQHPNVEASGWVSQDALVQLYSNALYTLFPFTDEEFGYVPVESMACGTPALTNGTQGPAELVVDDVTGWLARDDEEMVKTAVRLWEHRETSEEMRFNCRREALKFDVATIAQQWLRFFDGEAGLQEAGRQN